MRITHMARGAYDIWYPDDALPAASHIAVARPALHRAAASIDLLTRSMTSMTHYSAFNNIR